MKLFEFNSKIYTNKILPENKTNLPEDNLKTDGIHAWSCSSKHSQTCWETLGPAEETIGRINFQNNPQVKEAPGGGRDAAGNRIFRAVPDQDGRRHVLVIITHRPCLQLALLPLL